MKKSIVAIPEGMAISLDRLGWHRRVAKQFLPFDVWRSLRRDVVLRRIVSVVQTSLGGITIS